MIYDRKPHTYSDGQWHCPFNSEWVERMRRVAAVCKKMDGKQLEKRLWGTTKKEDTRKENFLSNQQDERGLPVCYNEDIIISRLRIRCDVYDYSTIPDVVVTNGQEDWPLCVRWSVLMA